MNEKTAVPRLPFLQALALPWSALKLIRAQPGLMAVNVLIMTGMMLVMSTDAGVVLGAPLILAFAVGGLAWLQAAQTTMVKGFPWVRLLRLSIAFYFLTLPLILVVALVGDLGKGAFLLLYALSLPTIYFGQEMLLWGSPFMTNVLLFAAILPVCLAPARVAVHGQGARQALWFSVRCWLRNPVATLVIAIIALIVAGGLALVEAFYWRYGAQGRLALYLSMAATYLVMIAVLTAFGRRIATVEPRSSPAVPASDCSERG